MNARVSVSRYWAALRMLLVMTVLVGVLYPLVVWAVAQIPGLRDKANGSLMKVGGTTVGSSLIGQAFTDAKGNPLVQYFQSRPSDAGDGYDPMSTAASNLGPENVVDTPPDPSVAGDTGTQSLLTQVCSRSLAVGKLEGVDGSRPYCTAGGVGAVLGVFHDGGANGPITRVVSVNEPCPATPFVTSYRGVAVECAKPGDDFTSAVIVPIRGDAPAHPAVPADAVTASGSGLDPDISVAYADLQVARVARARGVSVDTLTTLVKQYTTQQALGFLGEPVVNVLELNTALDQKYLYQG